MGPPSDVSWFINPYNYSYLRTINHSEIGVICTNLAIERGPHIVELFIHMSITTINHCNYYTYVLYIYVYKFYHVLGLVTYSTYKIQYTVEFKFGQQVLKRKRCAWSNSDPLVT